MTRASGPVLVTTAPQSPRDEQRHRERRYLVTMAVRTVCFVLAIVLMSVGLRWLAAFAIAGSLVLPWIAVVMANAGPRRTFEQPALYQRAQPRQLDSGDDVSRRTG